jgi:hypothetical protein
MGNIFTKTQTAKFCSPVHLVKNEEIMGEFHSLQSSLKIQIINIIEHSELHLGILYLFKSPGAPIPPAL